MKVYENETKLVDAATSKSQGGSTDSIAAEETAIIPSPQEMVDVVTEELIKQIKSKNPTLLMGDQTLFVVDPTLAKKVAEAEALSKHIEFVPAPGKAAIEGLLAFGGHVAIPDEDLPFFEAFADALVAGVTILVGTGSPIIPVATICIVGAKLAWEAFSHIIKLDDEESLVITALKECKGGSTEEQLSQRLDWSPEMISEVLARLQKVVAHNEAVVSIVVKDGKGRWHTTV